MSQKSQPLFAAQQLLGNSQSLGMIISHTTYYNFFCSGGTSSEIVKDPMTYMMMWGNIPPYFRPFATMRTMLWVTPNFFVIITC